MDEYQESELTGWIRGSRIASAGGLAAMLGVFLIWWKLWGDPGPVLQKINHEAIVEEVHRKSYVVRIESGEKVLVASDGTLKVGQKTPVTEERHAKERSFYIPSAIDSLAGTTLSAD